MTTDLYSVLPGIQPSAQEILEAELLCTQILSAKYPDMDLRTGTGLRDLVIRPSALLMALTKKGVDYIFSQNSLTNVDDSTPANVVDSILSNWFLDRQIGTLSVISARLYFARQKNVTLSSGVYFSTDNVSKFYPSETTSFSSTSMTFDSFSNEYYIDVDLIAEKEGSTYNIGTGSLLYFSNFDPFFLRAEINFLKSASIPSETNSLFINRAKTAISTRNLINKPSIDSNLRAAFNYIDRLISIGMGDVEMIRDQITAVFQAPVPVLLSALTSVSTLATATLSDHGYSNGQLVTIAGAVPTAYNGDYVITVTDLSHFTYVMDTSSSVVTSLPTVAAVNNPILIHNGGMVDVYCAETLATAIIQITLDTFGKAPVTGPIYRAVRSSISGGGSPDTMPTINTSSVSSIGSVGTAITATTSIQHNFNIGDVVTITGATQIASATGITSSGLIATVAQSAHGYHTGNTVTIRGATVAGYNGTFLITSTATNTFTYAILTTLGTTTGSITTEVNLINGAHTVTGVAGSTFTFNIIQAIGSVAGTIIATAPIDYTITNAYTQSKTIANITCSGLVVTVTLPDHGYIINRHVTISNNVSEYNGAQLITEILNPNQFTFNVPVTVSGTFTSGSATFIIPNQDFGFSQSQVLIADFGLYNANKTVSLEIDYFQNLDSIQNYLNSSAVRVICADYLARGFNFYSLDMVLNSYNSIAPDPVLAQAVIADYLSKLKVGDMLVVSDIVAQLRLNGIVNIQNPPQITYTKYTRDLTPAETGNVTNILDPNDITNVFLLNSVTTNTLVLPAGSVIIN